MSLRKLVPIRVTLTTVESGRHVVRSVGIDVEPGAYPIRLELAAEGLVLVRVPLQLWDSEAADDDD